MEERLEVAGTRGQWRWKRRRLPREQGMAQYGHALFH